MMKERKKAEAAKAILTKTGSDLKVELSNLSEKDSEKLTNMIK